MDVSLTGLYVFVGVLAFIFAMRTQSTSGLLAYSCISALSFSSAVMTVMSS